MQLPNGWKETELESIAQIFDGTHQTPDYVEEGVPFVSVENIDNIWGTDKFITQEAYDAYPAKPHVGDILMTRITAGVIGKTALVNLDKPLAYYVSLGLIRCDKNGIDPSYLCQYIEGKYFRKELNKRIIHTAFPKKINLGDIGKCFVAYPPLEEQKKIAETLSTWDSAIEKMEKLIECKEKIHAKLLNDCMHCADWKISSIESVATVKKGIQLNGENMISNGSYYVMNGGVVPSGYTDEWNTPENTVSISEGGNSCGFVAFNDEKFWAGGHCYTLIDVSPEVLPKFLFHYLKNKEKEIMKLRVGSGLPNIQKDSITNFEFKYPTKKEQKNIVEILDSSQKELSLLKQQLALYKKQKQGLMQKLLIGEWRVK